ncbi:MAG: hypothetical protein GFH25_541186n383 [Chloroflexi bacterium AL-N10]|nr:hypothetical protein [Chloroflexi bacterium AL-N1]NOK66697.1 hypothetical protein [Chloroflexi bacterium AL-N10]NOK72085.1 hypothetical protein [Chloroflexi bacterium AL-N5]
MSHKLRLWLSIVIYFTITGCSTDPTTLQEPTITVEDQTNDLVVTNIPSVPEILPIAATLSLDQTWILVNYHLFAVGIHGQLTPLQDYVEAYVARRDNPPLLLVRTRTESYELVDPLHWRRIKLDIPQGWFIQIFLALSSDQNQVAFTAQHTNSWQIHVVDLQSKTERVLVDQSTPLEPPIDFIADPPYPIKWHNDSLYLHAQASADALIWRSDLSDIEPLLHNVHHIESFGNYGLAADTSVFAFARDIQVNNEVISELVISDPQTGDEESIDQSVGHGVYNVYLSPDATRLAYSEIVLPNATHYDVWLYSLETQQIIKLNRLTGLISVNWSPDSKRLIVDTRRHIFLYDQDGTLIGQLTKPADTDALHVVDDQLLMLSQKDHRPLLQWYPFKENASPAHPDIVLPPLQTTSVEIVYVP